MGLNIGIITYAAPHLKTEQLVLGLRVNPIYEMTIFALPYRQRNRREVLFQHRPEQGTGVSGRQIADSLGLMYIPCGSETDIGDFCDYYIIAGAGIIPGEAIGNKKIINCHPGIIPISRGLDSFKWAILNRLPIGNTLHFIDQSVDAGRILCRLQTPLYQADSIESYARRHYEAEIMMLVNFESLLRSDTGPTNTESFDQYPPGEPQMRMPRDAETGLRAAFEEYKEVFAAQ
ncbi:MAG: hypothetical protein LBS32_03230 [Clostridiales Family XIII bacterium]|jgi:phosphoribosylglycinamide formyltransferase-1|nr:hypothetical protein [Clostridiales Family XIII bacterium]